MTVQWWGVRAWGPLVIILAEFFLQINAMRYPVWASLAWDYLSIMASSVSSKRVFSSAGITISKHHNQLKGDIVKALQGLKCMIRHDLLFRELPPTAQMELTDSEGTSVEVPDADTVGSPKATASISGLVDPNAGSDSWDSFVEGLESKDEPFTSDTDSNDGVYVQSL